MLIIYKSGPKAGTTAHVPRSPEIECLLDAGIIEQVQEYVPPAKVTWSVNVGQVTQRLFINGRCSRAVCGTFRYEGPAADASKFKFLHSCGAGAMPESIPTDIVNRYAAAKNEEQPVVGEDEVNYWGAVHAPAPKPHEYGPGKPLGHKLAYEDPTLGRK
jgi:hypothetical protein